MANTSTHIQQQRVLALLQQASQSTLSLREAGIMHPAARVQELREKGYHILTHWTHGYTSDGEEHRIAKYVLLGEASA